MNNAVYVYEQRMSRSDIIGENAGPPLLALWHKVLFPMLCIKSLISLGFACGKKPQSLTIRQCCYQQNRTELAGTIMIEFLEKNSLMI